MPMQQGATGPFQFELINTIAFGSVFSMPNSQSPQTPFTVRKRELWVNATDQPARFGNQAVEEITDLGVQAASCTDFVKYLRGQNGGPPPYAFDRFSNDDAQYADRPDLFASSPGIPGWTTPCHLRVQFTGTCQAADGTSVPFQGVILRRLNGDNKSGQEYWLLNAPGGGFAPDDDVTFLGQTTTTKRPKELITTFPDELPDPQSAGSLSTYFFWLIQFATDELAPNSKNWQTQICG